MAVVVIANPTEPIPSLDEVKAHLRARDFDDDDADILSKIWGAITEFDDPNLGFLGRSIIARPVEVRFDEFSDCLDLEVFPVLDGVDYPLVVKYDDDDGVEQTLVDTTYRVLDRHSSSCRVVLKSGESWPGTFVQDQAVRVSFWAGYSADDIRINNFKSAVKLHVEMTYDGDPERKMNFYETIYRLLQPYKVLRV